MAARKLHRGKDPLHDQACFFFQQCAEKYLKGLIEEAGLSVPYTHLLKDLLTLLRPHHPSLGLLRRGLVFLTRFAVGTRYPGDNASRRQARAAARWAEQVRAAARVLLGLPVAPARRKKSP